MSSWLLKLLGFDPVGKIVDGLVSAHQAKLDAKNDADRIRAEIAIKSGEIALADREQNADVIKTAMKTRIFWVVWSIAAVPTALWYGWGMMDSLFNGILPDVAALPPQLKEYADTVWQNIFYTGVAGVGFELLHQAIRRR